MSPSAEYEPLPGSDPVQPDSQPVPAPPPLQKSRSRLVTARRLLLFSLTILCVSFAAFKSGQWSADKALLSQPPEASPTPAPSEHSGEDIAIEPPISSPSNNTDMSGGGKYSVG